MRSIAIVLGLLTLAACGEEENDEAYAALEAELDALREQVEEAPQGCEDCGEMQGLLLAVRDLERDIDRLNNQMNQASQDVFNGRVRLDDLSEQIGQLNGRFITEDTTWWVGRSSRARFTDLHAAMEALSRVSIRPGATVTLRVEDGVYSMGSTLDLNHPDGTRLKIIGNEEEPDRVVLAFHDVVTGVFVSQGHHVGLFSGFKLMGDVETTTWGLEVWEQSSLNADHLIVEQWGNSGVYVGWNASLLVWTPGGLETAYNGQNGMTVVYGGFAHAIGIPAHDNGTNGVNVNFNSVAELRDAHLEDNDQNGADVYWSSMVNLRSASIEGNASHGAVIQYSSAGYLGHARAVENGATGFNVGMGSSSYGYKALADSNGTFGFHTSYGSVLRAEQSQSLNHGHSDHGYGYHAGQQSWMRVVGAVTSGNVHDYNMGTKDDGYNRLIYR